MAFSKTEKRVLEILGRRKMSIKDITDKFYGPKPPFNPSNRIASVIRSIAAKCIHFEEPFRIEGKGAGRRGRTVWKVKI